jgi:hypothetical protein
MATKAKNLTELVNNFFTSGDNNQRISNTWLMSESRTNHYPDSKLELWLYNTCIARISKEGKLFITYGKYRSSMTTSKRLWSILSDTTLNLSRQKIAYYTKLARDKQPNEIEIIEYKK